MRVFLQVYFQRKEKNGGFWEVKIHKAQNMMYIEMKLTSSFLPPPHQRLYPLTPSNQQKASRPL